MIKALYGSFCASYDVNSYKLNVENVFPKTHVFFLLSLRSQMQLLCCTQITCLSSGLLLKLYLHNDVILLGETWKEIEIRDRLLHFLLVEHALTITFLYFYYFAKPTSDFTSRKHIHSGLPHLSWLWILMSPRINIKLTTLTLMFYEFYKSIINCW